MIIKLGLIIVALTNLVASTEISNGHSNLPFGWKLVKINRKLTNSSNLSQINTELITSVSTQNKDNFDQNDSRDVEVDLEAPPGESFPNHDVTDKVNENKLITKKLEFKSNQRIEEINSTKTNFTIKTANLDEISIGRKNESIQNGDGVDFTQEELDKYFLPKQNQFVSFVKNENVNKKDEDAKKIPSIIDHISFNKKNEEKLKDKNEEITIEKHQGIKHFVVKKVNINFTDEELNKYFLPKQNNLKPFLKLKNEQNSNDGNKRLSSTIIEEELNKYVLSKSTKEKHELIKTLVGKRENIDFTHKELNKHFLPKQNQFVSFIKNKNVQNVNKNDEDTKKFPSIIDEAELNKHFLPKSTKLNEFSFNKNNKVKLKEKNEEIKIEKHEEIKNSLDKEENIDFIDEELNKYFLPKQNNLKPFLKLKNEQNSNDGNKKLLSTISEEDLIKYFLPKSTNLDKFSFSGKNVGETKKKDELIKTLVAKKEYIDFTQEEINKYFLPKQTHPNIFSFSTKNDDNNKHKNAEIVELESVMKTEIKKLDENQKHAPQQNTYTFKNNHKHLITINEKDLKKYFLPNENPSNLIFNNHFNVNNKKLKIKTNLNYEEINKKVVNNVEEIRKIETNQNYHQINQEFEHGFHGYPAKQPIQYLQKLPTNRICRFRSKNVIFFKPHHRQFQFHHNVRTLSPSDIFHRMRNNVFG